MATYRDYEQRQMDIKSGEEMDKISSRGTARMRYCWNCGAELGVFTARDYDPSDTCGSQECEREARNQIIADREEAHQQLDDDRGW